MSVCKLRVSGLPPPGGWPDTPSIASDQRKQRRNASRRRRSQHLPPAEGHNPGAGQHDHHRHYAPRHCRTCGHSQTSSSPQPASPFPRRSDPSRAGGGSGTRDAGTGKASWRSTPRLRRESHAEGYDAAYAQYLKAAEVLPRQSAERGLAARRRVTDEMSLWTGSEQTTAMGTPAKSCGTSGCSSSRACHRAATPGSGQHERRG